MGSVTQYGASVNIVIEINWSREIWNDGEKTRRN